MSDSVYSFRAGPTYRAASRQELFDSAMEQPLSLTSTFFDQAKGGMLESYGLGTAVRDFAIPDGAVTPETTARSALRLTNPLTAAYESTRLAVQAFREDSPVLDEAKYKSSPWYRENIPWDAGMTEARAKALSEWDDAKKVRQFYAEKRPISSFLGNLTGQAFDPINYVPVGGPLVRAAAVARAGRIGGTVVTGAVDAATNTALAGLATRETRERFGDDVSFQAMVSEIATAALIGAAFGGVSGAMEARTAARALADAQRSLSTLKATQEARIALNEAIDGVVRGEDVTLSPNATEAMARIANNVQSAETPAILSGVGTKARIEAPAETARGIEGGGTAPTIVYHGTAAKFENFDARFLGKNTPDAAAKRGFFFTSDPAVAETYATRKGLFWTKKGEVKAVSLKLENPYVVDMKGRSFLGGNAEMTMDLITEGVANKKVGYDKYDSVIFKNVDDTNGTFGVAGRVSDVYFVPDVSKITPQSSRKQVSVLNSAARPTPALEGRAPAETRIAKPDNYKALADQYRVDPETGDFPELADIDNLRAEGRLTADDIAELDAAASTVDDAKAYGEALKTVVGCLL